MKKQFKVSYYLRSNYENKEGKNPIMVRIILDGEMVNLGSSQLSVKKSLWSNSTSRAKGRTAEAVALNASLDALTASLYELFRKHEYDDYLTAELFKSLFLGDGKEFATILPVFDKVLSKYEC